MPSRRTLDNAVRIAEGGSKGAGLGGAVAPPSFRYSFLNNNYVSCCIAEGGKEPAHCPLPYGDTDGLI